MSGNPQEPDYPSLLGQSVMGISCAFWFLNDAGEDEVLSKFACTGFATSYRNQPVLITAGHVIGDILNPIIVNNEYKQRKVRVCQVNLMDYFGQNPLVRKPTPFSNYADCNTWRIDHSLKRDSDGLDFGLILLPELFWNGFFDNGGKILDMESWSKDGEEFEGYKMVGLPVEKEYRDSDYARLGVFSLSKSSDNNVRIHDGKPVWFVGTMPCGVTSVEGVSGGPIFGLRRTDAGMEYRLVAIQSWQSSEVDKVYGTPASSIRQYLEHEINNSQQALQ